MLFKPIFFNKHIVVCRRSPTGHAAVLNIYCLSRIFKLLNLSVHKIKFILKFFARNRAYTIINIVLYLAVTAFAFFGFAALAYFQLFKAKLISCLRPRFIAFTDKT